MRTVEGRTPAGGSPAIIGELVEARRRIVYLAACISPKRQDVVFLGEWRVKELLAHLIGWDYTNLEAVPTILAGERPDFYSRYDRDWRGYNATLVQKHLTEDYAALLSSVRESHAALMDHLATVQPAEFGRDRGLRWKGFAVTIQSLLATERDDERRHFQQMQALVQ